MTRNKSKPEPAGAKPSAFESLADALTGRFDAPLRDLPDALRKRVERAFAGWWDTLSAEHRRHRAREWDCEHDPAREEDAQRGFDSAVEQHRIESEIRQAEQMNPQTPLDLDSKDQRLARLRRELTDVGSQSAGPSTQERDAGCAACAEFRAMKKLTADEVSITFVAGGGPRTTAWRVDDIRALLDAASV